MVRRESSGRLPLREIAFEKRRTAPPDHTRIDGRLTHTFHPQDRSGPLVLEVGASAWRTPPENHTTPG